MPIQRLGVTNAFFVIPLSSLNRTDGKTPIIKSDEPLCSFIPGPVKFK